jgi:hypothetical protein
LCARREKAHAGKAWAAVRASRGSVMRKQILSPVVGEIKKRRKVDKQVCPTVEPPKVLLGMWRTITRHLMRDPLDARAHQVAEALRKIEHKWAGGAK